MSIASLNKNVNGTFTVYYSLPERIIDKLMYCLVPISKK